MVNKKSVDEEQQARVNSTRRVLRDFLEEEVGVLASGSGFAQEWSSEDIEGENADNERNSDMSKRKAHDPSYTANIPVTDKHRVHS